MNKKESMVFKEWVKKNLELEDQSVYKTDYSYIVSLVVEQIGEIQIDEEMRIDLSSEFLIVRGREIENWFICYDRIIAFNIHYFHSDMEGTHQDRRKNIEELEKLEDFVD